MNVAGGDASHRLDLGAMSDRLSWMAEDLQRTGEQLRQAMDGVAERTYEAASSDGLVRVTVDGRCRVASVELSPHVLRQDPDTLDAVLTATLNDALGQARTGAGESLLEGLPASMRSSIERTIDDARRDVRR